MSFPDGTLVRERATFRPIPVVYRMSGGQRRRIPDRETLTLLATGTQVQDLASADLAAIPEGSPLPTRRDGTLYGGTGSTFAFLLQGGHKQAVPDATTLRDAGHGVAESITISASDLADIPDGAPLPSTSRFLKPPPSGVPLVLLPVRLETRFQPGELWVRVYPDDVHVNSFEPELTAEESSARADYLAQAGGDGALTAFAGLARQFGPERAAWIASPAAKPGAKASSWTLAPFTNTLPERWIVIGYQGNAAGVVLGVGKPIDRLAGGGTRARRAGTGGGRGDALGGGFRSRRRGRHGAAHPLGRRADARLQPPGGARTAERSRSGGGGRVASAICCRRTTTPTGWSSCRTARPPTTRRT